MEPRNEERLSQAALTERQRPSTFGELIGQDAAGALLRILAAEEGPQRRGRSVLLHGPDGTGKSCLADIYAAALLCRHSAAHRGEACGNCRDCAKREAGRHANLLTLDEAELRSAGALERIASAYGSYAWSDGWMVIVIDRSDHMPPESWDALHRRLERTASGITFVLTTSDLRTAPQRTREVLLQIELRELSVPERELLLTRTCRAEGFTYDENALTALALRCSGRPRALLHSLEAIALTGAVTKDKVVAYFADRREEIGLRYLERMVARTSLAQQVAVLDDACLPPKDAGDVVRGVLGSVLSVRALRLEDRQLSTAYPNAAKRIDLATALLERADELRLTPRQVFNRLISWWSEAPTDRASLIARMNGFDEWLNGAGAPPASVALSATGSTLPRRERRPKSELQALETGAARRGRGRGRASADFFSEDEVRRVWDAGSFLIQRYGLFFNARLSLCWGGGARDDEQGIGSALTNMQRELRLWMNRTWQSAEMEQPLNVVRSHVRDETGQRWSHLVLTSPSGADVSDWLRRYRRRRPDPLEQVTRVDWDPPAHEQGRALQRHQELLAFMLSAIDPAWRESVADETGAVRSLAMSEILGVAAPRSAGERFTEQRTFASRYIQHNARVQASALLPPLSIFDESAWWAARTGWEMNEHAYRRDCEAQLRRVIKEIDIRWPPGERTMMERRKADLSKAMSEWKAASALRSAGRPGFGTRQRPSEPEYPTFKD